MRLRLVALSINEDVCLDYIYQRRNKMFTNVPLHAYSADLAERRRLRLERMKARTKKEAERIEANKKIEKRRGFVE